MTATASTPTTVKRADIEAKLREIQGEATATGEAARSALIVGGVVVVAAVVGVAYLLGKRKAKRKTTVVEVRRV